MLHVFQDGFDGRKTRARGQEHQRFVRVFTQEEAALRALDALDFFFFHRTKDMVGELAAGHVADVQLNRRRTFNEGVWRIGH